MCMCSQIGWKFFHINRMYSHIYHTNCRVYTHTHTHTHMCVSIPKCYIIKYCEIISTHKRSLE